MTIEELRAEIVDGPMAAELAPLVAESNDSAIAAALNRQDVAGLRPLPAWRVKLHAIEAGYYPRIVAATKSPVADLAALATSIYDYINDHRFERLDLERPSTVGMLAALVAAGVISKSDHDQLTALAAGQRSRAEVVWGDGFAVTANAVAAALGRP